MRGATGIEYQVAALRSLRNPNWRHLGLLQEDARGHVAADVVLLAQTVEAVAARLRTAEAPEEFFAVCTEYHFSAPTLLRAHLPTVAAHLDRFYGASPFAARVSGPRSEGNGVLPSS